MVKEGSYLEKALPIPIDTAMVQRVLEPPQTGLHHSPGLFDDRIWINSLVRLLELAFGGGFWWLRMAFGVGVAFWEWLFK